MSKDLAPLTSDGLSYVAFKTGRGEAEVYSSSGAELLIAEGLSASRKTEAELSLSLCF